MKFTGVLVFVSSLALALGACGKKDGDEGGGGSAAKCSEKNAVAVTWTDKEMHKPGAFEHKHTLGFMSGMVWNGKSTSKIGHVVLASPDLDLDVVSQRFEAEQFFEVAEHLTIYVSAHDRAIGVAAWLHRSRRRLGQLRPEELSPEQRARLAQVGAADIIDARVATGVLGHSYFHSSPAVSSDLLLLLRYDAAAGSPQRPLKEVAPSYWALENERYPSFAAD